MRVFGLIVNPDQTGRLQGVKKTATKSEALKLFEGFFTRSAAIPLVEFMMDRKKRMRLSWIRLIIRGI